MMKKIVGTLFLLLLCSSTTAWADDRDQDRARAALEAGDIQSFGTIEEVVTKRVPGKIIDVELEQDDSVWTYKLKLRDTRGQVFEVEVNAASGEILDIDLDD